MKPLKTGVQVLNMQVAVDGPEERSTFPQAETHFWKHIPIKAKVEQQ